MGYIWLFYGPLQWFSVILNWMSHAFAAAERIFSVLDTPMEVYEAPDAVHLPKIRGEICFEDVRFSYERGKEVINEFRLKVLEREHQAVSQLREQVDYLISKDYSLKRR